MKRTGGIVGFGIGAENPGGKGGAGIGGGGTTNVSF